jgi:hypothetical protein
MNRMSLAALAAFSMFAMSSVAMAQNTSAEAPATTAAAPASFTDAQLQSFAAASVAIDPINRSLLQGATPEAQAQAATQIRALLEQHGLDGATYNAIAAAAQADPALAQRIASLQTHGAHAGGAGQP